MPRRPAPLSPVFAPADLVALRAVDRDLPLELPVYRRLSALALIEHRSGGWFLTEFGRAQAGGQYVWHS